MKIIFLNIKNILDFQIDFHTIFKNYFFIIVFKTSYQIGS